MQLRLLFSRQVHLEAKRNPDFSEFAMQSYSKFLNRDWGSIPDEDKEANDKAIILGGDVLGVYEMGEHSTKTILVIIPIHRQFLQVMFKRELNKKKKDRQDFVLYGSDGKQVSN